MEARACQPGFAVDERGLSDQVEVLLRDYREVTALESYDAVCSIEMGEHIGEGQYPTYAAIMFSALKPTGRLVLQQMSRRADEVVPGLVEIEVAVPRSWPAVW
ncbi:MAG: SAM-dependent methyltransferase [Mycobacterium sp.]